VKFSVFGPCVTAVSTIEATSY